MLTGAQADTYRRMRDATGGDWAGSHAQTNAVWVHYLADTLLTLKTLPGEVWAPCLARCWRRHLSQPMHACIA